MKAPPKPLPPLPPGPFAEKLATVAVQCTCGASYSTDEDRWRRLELVSAEGRGVSMSANVLQLPGTLIHVQRLLETRRCSGCYRPVIADREIFNRGISR